MRLPTFLLLGATVLAGQDPVDLRGWMERGVQAFQDARYPEAVAAFERAAAIDPTNGAVQLYLGTAYLQQYIPGAESVENARIADAAQTHFQRALDLEPANKVALASMASLSLNQKKWDDAERWYEKLIAADPNNADAYYSMGFLAWSRWYPAYSKARAGVGMRPQDPGPIQDAGVRADLMAHYGAILDSGLRNLEKALEINPQYDDAMAYMNLLVRERADLRDTAAEYARDIAIADEWVQKALAAKKAKAGVTSVPPSRIRIAGEVVQQKRIRDVAPIYPDMAKQAGVQGAVQLAIVIDRQGRVSDIRVVQGHPLLISAAIEAVKQWEFQPTLLNGQPVEVATDVSVNFAMK